MCNRILFKTIILLMLIASSYLSHAGKGSLEGWGPFRFGMPIDEYIKTVTKNRSKWLWVSDSKESVEVNLNRDTWLVYSKFTSDKPTLDSIELILKDADGAHQAGLASTMDEVKKYHNRIYSKLARKYGPDDDTKLSTKDWSKQWECSCTEAIITSEWSFDNKALLTLKTSWIDDDETPHPTIVSVKMVYDGPKRDDFGF